MNRQMARSHEFHAHGTRAMPARPIHVTIEDEREFREAMEQYRSASGRPFPTWSEVLEVLHALGYAKRIWKPVDSWASLNPSPNDSDPSGLAGWYARVETLITT